MNRVAVTIVDFMAFLVPGVVLLFALVFMPVPDEWLLPLDSFLRSRMPILANPWAAGGCWVLSAYLLGFLLRLTSIDLMNRFTWRRWVKRLEAEAFLLEGPIEASINDADLVAALKAIAKSSSARGLGRYAPYFHFSKRIIRTRPELWVEAERLEAEVRLSAGLFVPFIVLALDGILRIPRGPAAFVLVATGVVGAAMVVGTFPSRRVKEVLHVHFLALVAMRSRAQGGAVVEPPFPT